MSKRIPIPRTIEDPRYRYTMPLLETRFEGRGIGVKTNLINIVPIAKALQVPTEYLLQFFTYDLGTKTTTNKQNERVVSGLLNGEIQDSIINDSIDKFIDAYVLCKGCGFPEIVMSFPEPKEFFKVCNSCGHKEHVNTAQRMAK